MGRFCEYLDCTATGSSALRESGPDLRAFDWLED